ncbi:MAG: hypothetical protein ABFR90_08210 [Planctomycetota bacterium]
MKQALKNPNLYYIAVPVIAALWALMAGLVFYPKSVDTWETSKTEYKNVQDLIDKIVKLQPERLAYKVDENDTSGEFDFTKTINDFAQVFSIPSSKYGLNVRGEAQRSGRRTRSATISIETIDIEKMAQFISAMLLRWPDLKCETLSFQKIKDTKNNWKVDMSLTYYY